MRNPSTAAEDKMAFEFLLIALIDGCVFVKETGKAIDPRNGDNFSIKVQNDIPF